MLIGLLLPALFTLVTSLSISTNPTSLQLPAQNTSSVAVSSPWPSTPYAFSVSDSFPFTSYWVSITGYGAPGPSNTTQALEVIDDLKKKIISATVPREVVFDQAFSVPGLAVTFKAPDAKGVSGIDAWQINGLLVRMQAYTRAYGAMGVQGGKTLGENGKFMEMFELVWMFE